MQQSQDMGYLKFRLRASFAYMYQGLTVFFKILPKEFGSDVFHNMHLQGFFFSKTMVNMLYFKISFILKYNSYSELRHR